MDAIPDAIPMVRWRASPNGSSRFERQLFVQDGELTSFGLGVMPSGQRSFIVQYRTNERRSRRRVPGTYPMKTVDQARRLAREW